MKFEFKNKDGHTLSGQLELPSGTLKAMALFAHCFTCSKDFVASRTISKALASLGVGVLRFDFTGLGNSEGDFANTNFSSNVQDLISAEEALRAEYGPVQILIGHSLGGAAVLKAALELPDVISIVTIGAPSSVEHITHLFKDQVAQIRETGTSIVQLEGREFEIKKQFLDDIKETKILDDLPKMKKALLVMHSPLDNTVSIDHAAEIFVHAKHPKSFISLDRADHLLTQKVEAQYVARTIAAWVSKYLPVESPMANSNSNSNSNKDRPKLEAGQVLVRSRAGGLFTQDIFSQDHQLVADEPVSHKGDNLGMNPYQLLLSALGACTSMTLKMYAEHKGLDLKGVEVLLSHEKIHAEDCDGCETKKGKVDQITKLIKVTGDFTEEQKQRFYEIAERCPVNKTLLSEVSIKSQN